MKSKTSLRYNLGDSIKLEILGEKLRLQLFHTYVFNLKFESLNAY